MDWSLILGLIGIAVSIAVGWITFRLTERRARNQRHATAKATVLQELSKSLGEDSVPTPSVIEATLRSVVREAADPKLKLSLDEILDDLIRQVTSDPFLDAERRRKLQGDIEQVRKQASEVKRERAFTDDFLGYGRTYFLSRASSIIVSILVALTVLSGLTAIIMSNAEIRQQLGSVDRNAFGPILLAGVTVAVILTIFTVFGDDIFSSIKRLFSRRSKDD